MVNINNITKSISSLLRKIDLTQHKRMLPLPNDMVFIIDSRDNVEESYNLALGLGHEPEMINKMIEFAKEGETYIEIGANYGDFALQMNKKLGEKGMVYTFEPGKNLYNCFLVSILLNAIPNIQAENLAILDTEKMVDFTEYSWGSFGSSIVLNGKEFYNQKVQATSLDKYFEGKENSLNILRVDAEGSECSAIRGAEKLINNSSDIRLFVEWQTPLLKKFESQESLQNCLTSLVDKGFIFLDIIQHNHMCHYSNYKLSVNNILMSDHLEFMAIREDVIQDFLPIASLEKSDTRCLSTVNERLFTASSMGDIDDVKKALSDGAEVNNFNSFGGSSLYIAAENGHKNIVEYLLEKNADVEIKSIHGMSPLFTSVRNNYTDISNLLLKNGANVESSIPNGATPLYIASYNNDVYQTALLMKYGAINTETTVSGKTSVERAREGNNQDILKLLLSGLDVFCNQTEDILFVEVCGKDNVIEVSVEV